MELSQEQREDAVLLAERQLDRCLHAAADGHTSISYGTLLDIEAGLDALRAKLSTATSDALRSAADIQRCDLHSDGPKPWCLTCQDALTRQRKILALTPARIALEAELRELKVRKGEVLVCAIEAGERSPEGVSSHTMLGDRWDRRIAKYDTAILGGPK